MKKNYTVYSFIILFALALLASCTDKITYGPDPYAGGAEPLGIGFREALPSPSQARPGTDVTFKIDGLLKYKPEDIQLFMNNIPARIVNITDTSVTSTVPVNASTGGVRVVVNGQIFAGPLLPIIGKAGIDLTFRSGTGTLGPIFSIKQLSNGQIYIGGNFTDYNGFSSSTKIGGIARLSNSGDFVKGMKFGEGVKGSILSINELANGSLLISGAFTNFDTINLVRNITRITNTGALDVASVPILNLTSDPKKSNLIAPTFNGGTDLSVVKTFVQNNKVTAIGNFQSYANNYYTRSTFDNILTDYFSTKQVVRMDMNGVLDSNYYMNKTTLPIKGLAGVNGNINDGYLQKDGKLVLVGSFTNFNATQSAGRIVRLDVNGNYDPSFSAGSGADDRIMKIFYSATTNKYIVVGSFNTFNGVPSNGIAVLNVDGSVDPSFKSYGFAGGKPNYVTQLSNGLILVSGTFTKYNDVIREGLLILNPDGTLAADYNNTGKLVGSIYDSLEGTNSLGQRTITLVGSISSFNGQLNVGNIVRMTIVD